MGTEVQRIKYLHPILSNRKYPRQATQPPATGVTNAAKIPTLQNMSYIYMSYIFLARFRVVFCALQMLTIELFIHDDPTLWKRRPPNGAPIPLLTGKCTESSSILHCRSRQDLISDDSRWLKPPDFCSLKLDSDEYKLRRALTKLTLETEKITGTSSLLFSAKSKRENMHYRSLQLTLLLNTQCHVSDHTLAPRSTTRRDEQQHITNQEQHEHSLEHQQQRQQTGHKLQNTALTAHYTRFSLSVVYLSSVYLILLLAYMQSIYITYMYLLQHLYRKVYHMLYHTESMDKYKYTQRCVPPPESNCKQCTQECAIFFYVMTLYVLKVTNNFDKRASLSHFLLTPSSKTIKSVGGRKKWRFEPSEAAVPPPTCPAHITELSRWVSDEKSRSLYQRDFSYSSLYSSPGSSLQREQTAAGLSCSSTYYTSTRYLYTFDVRVEHSTSPNRDPPKFLHANKRYEYDNSAIKTNYVHITTSGDLITRMRLLIVSSTVHYTQITSRDTESQTIPVNGHLNLAERSQPAIAPLLSRLFALEPRYCFLYVLDGPISAATTTPKDSDGQQENTSTSSSQPSGADRQNSRRNNIQSRAALFNGSRNSSSAGDDDDGNDGGDNRHDLPLPKQCEVESNLEEETEPRINSIADPVEKNDEVCDPNSSSQENDGVSDSDTSCKDLARINSTSINQSYSIYSMFDVSVLNGISRIWDTARNVSLFGAASHGLDRTITIHAEIETPTTREVGEPDTSLESDPEDLHLPDISNFSDALDITSAEQQEIVKPDDTTETETTDRRVKSRSLFVGFAKPEITPVSLKLKISDTPKLPGGDRMKPTRPRRLRSQSECSSLNRSGPYDIPTTILIRKSQRSQVRRNIRDNRADQTPLSRRRSASESESISKPGSAFKIDCIRARESGFYDCSLGLGEYYCLEYDYLDMLDTSKIDKGKFFSTLDKLLTIPEDDHQSQNISHPVQIAWNEEEIAAMSKTSNIAQHIDQRKCLLYLLTRMIRHSTNLSPKPPKFNGLSLSLLPENGRFQIEPCINCRGHPLPILHIGSEIGVSVVPKKHDQCRPNIHDIHLENLTLLTVFPETFSSMNISIPAERNKNEYHVLITPCFVEEPTFETDQVLDVNFPPESQEKSQIKDDLTAAKVIAVETENRTGIDGQSEYLQQTPNDPNPQPSTEKSTAGYNAINHVLDIISKDEATSQASPETAESHPNSHEKDQEPAGTQALLNTTTPIKEEPNLDLNEEPDVNSPSEGQKMIKAEDDQTLNIEPVPEASNRTETNELSADKTEVVQQPAESEQTPVNTNPHPSEVNSPEERNSLAEQTVTDQDSDLNQILPSKASISTAKSHLKSHEEDEEPPKTQGTRETEVLDQHEQKTYLRPENKPASSKSKTGSHSNKLGTGKNASVAHSLENTAKRSSSEDSSPCIKEKQLAKRGTNTRDVGKNNFISMKLSVGVVNTYSKDIIYNWLTHCGITTSKKNRVHKLRTKLLKYIQNIHEGKEKPKMSFVTSFLEKITYSELLAEAKRLEIPIGKSARESEARRKINEYLTAETHGEITPPQLLTTDEELSLSETDSDDSWEDESWNKKPAKNTQKGSTEPKKANDAEYDINSKEEKPKNASKKAKDAKQYPAKDESEKTGKSPEKSLR